jgi:hypothetical protein
MLKIGFNSLLEVCGTAPSFDQLMGARRDSMKEVLKQNDWACKYALPHPLLLPPIEDLLKARISRRCKLSQGEG